MDAILEVRDVSRHFGSLRAVDGCSFSVERRTITGLIGPNGAGKTTLFNLVSGSLRVTSGSIRFDGQEITRLKPYHRARLGIGRTFQITRVFPKMTLLENMMVASAARLGREEAAAYLELVNLADRMHDYAQNLSYGQQKLVELARVLMLDPKLILLDEPAAGVNPTLLQAIIAFIHRLRDEFGKTILIVEHNMDLVMGHCETVVVMNAGSVIAEGPPAEIQDDDQVLEAYFGKQTRALGRNLR